jgi:hypothetical protein
MGFIPENARNRAALRQIQPGGAPSAATLSKHPNKKVSRRLVLDAFLKTRSYSVTAHRCGITDNAVQNIVARAIRTARGLAGLPRLVIKPSPIILKRRREARAAMRAARRPATVPKNVVLTTREQLARLRAECYRVTTGERSAPQGVPVRSAVYWWKNSLLRCLAIASAMD